MKSPQVLFAALLFTFAYSAKAQTLVSLDVGSPPPWGPAGHTEVRYYYLPDIQSYYDIQSNTFIYYATGRWHRKASLPGRYRNYDLYDGYKVVMTDYYGETPYENFREHQMNYKIGYRGESQKTIGERPVESNARFKGDNKGEDKKKGHDEEGDKLGEH